MKMHLLLTVRRCLALFVLALALSASLSQAATLNPPQFLAYQSYLTDQNGNPLGSTNVGPKNYNVVFRIWDVQTGGTTNGSDDLYAEQQTVTINNGFFSVLLGQGSAYSNEPHTNALSGLFVGPTASSRYVEMTVLGIGASGANVTILPRAQLLTSPYAFLAANAVNAASAGSLVNNNNATQVVTVTNGFVGIGTTTPSFGLEVASAAKMDTTLTVAGLLTANGGLTLPASSTLTANGTANILNLNTYGASAFNAIVNSYGGFFMDAAAGYHQSSQGQFILDASGVAGGRFTVTTGGNVGIGNASPAQPLDVRGLMQVNTNGTVESQGPKNTFNGMVEAYFGPTDRYGMGQFVNGVTAIYSSGSYAAGSTQIGLIGASSFTPQLTVLHGGNVGIGTTTPSKLLDVSGDAVVEGNIYTGGGHIASTTGNNLVLDTSGDIFFRHENTVGSIGTFTDIMHVTAAGYLGIGTATPGCPVDIVGNVAQAGMAYFFVNSSGTGPAGAGSGEGGHGLSLRTSANITCGGELDVTSDGRVKEIVRRSDTSQDLAEVRQLQVTEYRKVDKVQFGGHLEKGVIAQEVETIIPEAVSTSTNFIPNIYAVAKAFACTNETLMVTMAQPHGLVAGDIVKLIADTGELKVTVASVTSPWEFTVAQPALKSQHLFVFGKQVNDFRAVNYDRLFTTGLGAIQELAKRTDELEAQTAQVAELKKQVTNMSEQMAQMKKLVAQLAEAAKSSKLASAASGTSGKGLTTASLDR